jgi:hypothetical protein
MEKGTLEDPKISDTSLQNLFAGICAPLHQSDSAKSVVSNSLMCGKVLKLWETGASRRCVTEAFAFSLMLHGVGW